MNALITKTKSALSAAALFAFGAAMAGLGLAAVSLLAIFALVAIGAAILTTPFLAITQPTEEDTAAAA
ncbi:hypothetical protein [uncultured Tateyamaria sp.]|uniref:hypothetical protein n=1 Tax=uncultured Tateyamaria sp. TaxID=455651 RepID=UPI00262F194E|nr:hypothetical protein [uncultured Tateyamaria sp.]